MSAHEDVCGCGECGTEPDDWVFAACRHYIATVKDKNAKPRHIGRALQDLRAAVLRAAPMERVRQ